MSNEYADMFRGSASPLFVYGFKFGFLATHTLLKIKDAYSSEKKEVVVSEKVDFQFPPI
jgi:hypothetical protein